MHLFSYTTAEITLHYLQLVGQVVVTGAENAPSVYMSKNSLNAALLTPALIILT